MRMALASACRVLLDTLPRPCCIGLCPPASNRAGGLALPRTASGFRSCQGMKGEDDDYCCLLDLFDYITATLINYTL